MCVFVGNYLHWTGWVLPQYPVSLHQPLPGLLQPLPGLLQNSIIWRIMTSHHTTNLVAPADCPILLRTRWSLNVSYPLILEAPGSTLSSTSSLSLATFSLLAREGRSPALLTCKQLIGQESRPLLGKYVQSGRGNNHSTRCGGVTKSSGRQPRSAVVLRR